jgi:general nucleoside transport system ATP-binding protein
VGELDTAATTARDLSHRMVGREVAPVAPSLGETQSPPGVPDGPPALEVRDLVVLRGATRAVDGVTLSVAPGEILGVAGVTGNGQSELLEALVGLRSVASGAVLLRGRDVTRWPVGERIAAGLAHIPEDRDDRGLVAGLPLEENLLLGRYGAFGGLLGLDRRRVRARAVDLLARFDVRPPDPRAAAGTLSGGNAQKLVVARELSGAPSLVLAGQPTRGVDVGAVEAIHARLRAARARGAGVLLVSADLDEILALSDRVIVMNRGRVAGAFPVGEASPERLGECMGGVVS